MIRFKVITLLCSLGVLQASSTLHLIDECLTKVEPPSVTPYKESLWDTMSTDARSHVWSFLSVCEQIRARCVAKSFRDGIHPMSNHRLNSKDRLAIDMIKGLQHQDNKPTLKDILTSSQLGINYFIQEHDFSEALGIQLLQTYPILFLSSMYSANYKYLWRPWLLRLSKRNILTFYRVSSKYDDSIKLCRPLCLTNDLLNHNHLIQDYHLIWELMKIKLTDYLIGSFFDNFDYKVNPTIMYQPISQHNICAVQKSLVLLSSTQDLLFYLQEVLTARQITYLATNLVHSGKKRFALSLFSYLPTVHDNDSTTKLNQDIAYELKQIGKDSTSPFYATSKKTLELFNSRTSYMGGITTLCMVGRLLYKGDNI